MDRRPGKASGDYELRRLPLLARARADRRVRRLTAITLVVCASVFTVAIVWLPRVATAIEWFFGAFMAILAFFEMSNLVTDWRRRRALSLDVPKPSASLSQVERQAAMVVSRVLLDNQEEVAVARSRRDFSKLENEIRHAASAFFLLAGENEESAGALRSQVVRILADGDEKPFAQCDFRPDRPAV